MGNETHSVAPIAQIFNEGFDPFSKQYGPLPLQCYKVSNAIMQCRTEEMGGHIYRCSECSNELTLYNSCRNRHCPTCQSYATAKWVQARIDEVLPVPYFHVVFTIPQQLRDIFYYNRVVCYSILFKAVNQTLQELAKDKNRLGGQIGVVSILHTWTQLLDYHPHLHCILPAGALVKDENRWVHCRNEFLFPFAVIKKMFRGKVLDFIKAAITNGEICFTGKMATFNNAAKRKRLFDTLYNIEWNVNTKKPFDNAERVIKYLGNYTHRIAISNKRIKWIEHGNVCFTYKDRKDNDKVKEKVVTVVEFIRRFLMHIVPSGFMRIRHFGFLSNALQRKLLPCIREILHAVVVKNTEKAGTHWYEIIESLTGVDPTNCTVCGKGKLRISMRIPKRRDRLMIVA